MEPLRNESHIATLLDVPKSARSGINTYTTGGESEPTHMSYNEFQTLVQRKARPLLLQRNFTPGKIILLHFQGHLENITWFWALVLVGGIPAMSTPLKNNREVRNSHFKRLNFLLRSPIVLTTRNLASSDFTRNEVLQVVTVEDIDNLRYTESEAIVPQTPIEKLTEVSSNNSTDGGFKQTAKSTFCSEEIAVIILALGNTGLSKAICLTHAQIFASLRGMMSSMPLPPGSALLNCTPLEQASSLIEIHFFAMFAGLDQVHVPIVDAQTDPLLFLRLLSKHDVSRTFAPNSFLYKLHCVLDTISPEKTQGVDLGGLLYIGFDREANNAENCARISDILAILRAKNQMGTMLN